MYYRDKSTVNSPNYYAIRYLYTFNLFDCKKTGKGLTG